MNKHALFTALMSLAFVALLHPHKSMGQPINVKEGSNMNQSITAIPAEETFNGTWPYQAKYTNVSGFRMHYVDEGRGPETLLLLHGEPTWSYLFRQQIATWSKKYRVIAIDHMGFGKSATPLNRTYWLQDHVDNLERFILSLDLQDITLVMHDFGGPMGMAIAIRHPDRIKQFISINGPLPAGQPDLAERIGANVEKSPWFQWIMRAEKNGALERVLSELNYNILSTLKLNGFERNEIINEHWLRAYSAPFPTPEHTVGAIGWAKGFAIGAHDFAAPDQETKLKISQKPALTIWGEADKTLHADEFIPLFRQIFPKGIVHTLPGVGHYSLEDAPEQTSQLVMEFLSAH